MAQIHIIHEVIVEVDINRLPVEDRDRCSQLFKKMVKRREGVESVIHDEVAGGWRVRLRPDIRGIERLSDDIRAIAQDMFIV